MTRYLHTVRTIAVLTMASLALSGAAGLAQDKPVSAPPSVRRAPPPAPPVVPFPRTALPSLPRMITPLPSARPNANRSGEQRCITGTRVAVELDGKAGSGVCLVERENWLSLIVADENGQAVSAYTDLSLTLALTILADRRMEPMWDEILHFSGPDLTDLRDRSIQRYFTRRVNLDLNVSRMGNPSRAMRDDILSLRTNLAIAHARAVAAGGNVNEALSLLVEQARIIAPERGGFDERNQRAWVALQNAQANLLQIAGRVPDAMTVLQQAEAQPRLGNDQRLEMMVNRAALLTESGNATAGLALIEAATASGGRRRGSGNHAAFWDQHLAWVRACSLHNLGRVDEAAVALAAFQAAHATQRATEASEDFEVASGFPMRAAVCMNDPAAAQAALAASGGVLLRGAVQIQPVVRHELATALRMHERLTADAGLADYASRWRQLPEIFTPALTRWADSAEAAPTGQPPEATAPDAAPVPADGIASPDRTTR